jgi:hypothetical protein
MLVVLIQFVLHGLCRLVHRLVEINHVVQVGVDSSHSQRDSRAARESRALRDSSNDSDARSSPPGNLYLTLIMKYPDVDKLSEEQKKVLEVL